MELRFSDREVAFRQEVREFLSARLPPDIRRKVAEFEPLTKGDLVSWQQTLNERGWATPSWPAEWGGPGWTPIERHIFLDELQQHPAPEALSFNVSMIGPAIGRFGTSAQKSRFMQRIASLEDWWC